MDAASETIVSGQTRRAHLVNSTVSTFILLGETTRITRYILPEVSSLRCPQSMYSQQLESLRLGEVGRGDRVELISADMRTSNSVQPHDIKSTVEIGATLTV